MKIRSGIRAVAWSGLLASACAIAGCGAAEPPDVALEEEVSPRGILFRSCTVEITGFTLAEDSEPVWRGVGTVIGADEIVAPYVQLERCERIVVRPLCCDEVEVEAVTGGGLDSGILILQAPLAAISTEFPIAPVTAADAPVEDGELVWSGSRPIPVGASAAEPAEGYLVGMMTPEPVRLVTYAGMGPRLEVPWGTDLFAPGSAIFNQRDQFVAVAADWGGSSSSLAVEADAMLAAARFDPVPTAQYAARALSMREQAVRARQIGQEHRTAGRLAEAMASLHDAVRLDPADWDAWYLLGVCLDLTGKPLEAIEALQKSLLLEPQWAEALYSLGLTLHKMEHERAAKHYYLRALEQAPHHADILNNLAAIAGRARRPDIAVERLEQALEIEPDRTQFQDNAERMRRSLAQARDRVRSAPDPGDNPEAHLKLAQDRWSTGDVEGAFAQLDRAEQCADGLDALTLPRAARLMWLLELEQYDQLDEVVGRTRTEFEEHPLGADITGFIARQVKLAKGDLTPLLEDEDR